jgi:hypothetical protein
VRDVDARMQAVVTGNELVGSLNFRPLPRGIGMSESVGLTACRQHARRGDLPSSRYVLHADPLERTVRGTAPAGHSNALANRALPTKG